jgi:hypothetical protein
MKQAIQQISKLIALLVFVTIFIIGYRFDQPFSIEMVLPVVIKAFVGAVIFGFGGIIIGDIVVKGVIEDIDNESLDPLEGGFEQRIYDLKKSQKVNIVEREIKFMNNKNGKK